MVPALAPLAARPGHQDPEVRTARRNQRHSPGVTSTGNVSPEAWSESTASSQDAASRGPEPGGAWSPAPCRRLSRTQRSSGKARSGLHAPRSHGHGVRQCGPHSTFAPRGRQTHLDSSDVPRARSQESARVG